VMSFSALFGGLRLLGILATFLLVGTNIGTGKILIQRQLDSHPISYVKELLSPNEEPYAPVSKWINENVHPGASVLVYPDYMMYPLMFHAPQAIYAWQLDLKDQQDPQFKDLPAIHFKGIKVPDYLIVFGPAITSIRMVLENWKQKGVDYKEVGRINTFWSDRYRPELFWRTFTPILNYDPETQAIYIFKKS
jgi:hypothetical protein